MKLQLALATALLAVSISAVQAADTRTPDILGSVSAEAVQALSKDDASKTRGEYAIYNSSGQFVGYYGFSRKLISLSGGYTFQYVGQGTYNGTTYYVSR